MNTSISFDSPISDVPKTHSRTVAKFNKIGVNTVLDLLDYAPKRLVDFSQTVPIAGIFANTPVTVKGTVISSKTTYTRSHLTIQKIKIKDASGELDLVWFNQPHIVRIFPEGSSIAVSGNAEASKSGKLQMTPAEYELLDKTNSVHTGRLVPVYSQKGGLSTRLIREKMQFALCVLSEADEAKVERLPPELLSKFNLIKRIKAMNDIHDPKTHEEFEQAKRRLAFDEFFALSLSSLMTKQEWATEKVSVKLEIDKYKEEIEEFKSQLPFDLTNSQKKAITEILNDMSNLVPMNRFLQGDVGSGKTVVAALACFVASLNTSSSIIMCPTEVLAVQHHESLCKMFLNFPEIGIHLITSKQKLKKEKNTFKSNIYIGTHALLNVKFEKDKIGLVVVDEQHRFGVTQRSKIKSITGNTHFLSMTATPIPRTIALTLFGELQMSSLTELPKNRITIKTYAVPDQKRQNAYEWMKKIITETGCQAYIVCPRIESDEQDSEIAENAISLKAATDEFEELSKSVFKDFKLGLLHGKMKNTEKNLIMEKFKNNEIQILLTTTVVEVGIDVPNADIIMIEGAERYGLATLHQLRGRVGRGKRQGYCLLFGSPGIPIQMERIKVFASCNLGAELAEYDYKNRGPGDIFGTSQSGYADLKYASMADTGLLMSAASAAQDFINKYPLTDFPALLAIMTKIRSSEISND